MKKNLIMSLALALASPLFAAGEGWMIDFEAAKKKALAEDKQILLEFTGSDWCPPCKMLKQEVLSQEVFLSEAKKKFILVELDFPKDKSKMTPETIAQNELLQKRYLVSGFPAILLLDSKGRPYAQTGYQPGGAKAYVRHLNELHAGLAKRNKNFTQAESLEGVEKAKALFSGLDGISQKFYSLYPKVSKEIIALDPEDTTGFATLQNRAIAEVAVEDAINLAYTQGKSAEAISAIDDFLKNFKLEDDERIKYEELKLKITIGNAMQKSHVDKVISAIDAFISEQKLTSEHQQHIIGMKIEPLIIAQRFDEAAQAIDQLIAIAPQSEAARYATGFKPRLNQMKAEAAKQPTPKK